MLSFTFSNLRWLRNNKGKSWTVGQWWLKIFKALGCSLWIRVQAQELTTVGQLSKAQGTLPGKGVLYHSRPCVPSSSLHICKKKHFHFAEYVVIMKAFMSQILSFIKGKDKSNKMDVPKSYHFFLHVLACKQKYNKKHLTTQILPHEH